MWPCRPSLPGGATPSNAPRTVSRRSGGEQQRVALARALVAQPRLVLADEPTGNLDGETGRQVIALLFDLARHQGTTLILITHDNALAERCDRIVRLTDGRIVEDRATAPSSAPLTVAPWAVAN